MNDQMCEKIRVVMFAPEKVVGGITTWWRTFKCFSNSEQIEYRVIDTSKLYEPLGRKANVRGYVLGSILAFKRLWILLSLLLTYKPHIVYLNCAPSTGFFFRDLLFLILVDLFGVSSIVHLHGGSITGFVGKSYLRRKITLKILQKSSKIIVICRSVQKYLEQNLVASTVTYIPNMLDDHYLDRVKDYQSFQGDHIKLLHVGWQAQEKGTLDLLQAMATLQQNVTCDFVGAIDPKFRPEIEAQIETFSLDDRVCFHGEIWKKDVLDKFYMNADVFVLSSWSEGFPMVVLEAMAWSLPIVSTPVGSVPDMLGSESFHPAGMVTANVKNADEIVSAIQILVDNPVNAKKMGRLSRLRLVEQYLASKVVPQIERTIQSVAQNKTG